MILPNLIDKTRVLARTLSGMAALGIGNRNAYNEVLRLALQATPEAYGTWCVWEPGALDGRDREFRNHPGHDHTGRYVPFWFNTGGRPELEPNTNYQHPVMGEYYLIPKQTLSERTVRLSPYVDCSGRKHLFTCHTVPIIQSGRFLGVVGIDVLPKRIENPPEDNASAVLSNREVEVLRWVAAGKTNAEIAVILGISPHTVKHHVARVIAKLGVENRRAAMRAWLNGEFSHE